MTPPTKRATSQSERVFDIEAEGDFNDEMPTPAGLRGVDLAEFRSHQALIVARNTKKMVSQAITKDDQRFGELNTRLDDQRVTTDQRFGEMTAALNKVALESATNSANVARMVSAVEDLTKIQTAQTVAAIQVKTAEKTAEVEDKADAKKTKRSALLKLLGLISGTGAGVEILHRLFG